MHGYSREVSLDVGFGIITSILSKNTRCCFSNDLLSSMSTLWMTFWYVPFQQSLSFVRLKIWYQKLLLIIAPEEHWSMCYNITIYIKFSGVLFMQIHFRLTSNHQAPWLYFLQTLILGGNCILPLFSRPFLTRMSGHVVQWVCTNEYRMNDQQECIFVIYNIKYKYSY